MDAHACMRAANVCFQMYLSTYLCDGEGTWHPTEGSGCVRVRYPAHRRTTRLDHHHRHCHRHNVSYHIFWQNRFDYLAAPENKVEAADFNRLMTANNIAAGCGRGGRAQAHAGCMAGKGGHGRGTCVYRTSLVAEPVCSTHYSRTGSTSHCIQVRTSLICNLSCIRLMHLHQCRRLFLWPACMGDDAYLTWQAGPRITHDPYEPFCGPDLLRARCSTLQARHRRHLRLRAAQDGRGCGRGRGPPGVHHPAPLPGYVRTYPRGGGTQHATSCLVGECGMPGQEHGSID